MPDNRRAAQPLQNAHLDFLRPKGEQSIKPCRESLHVSPGRPGDQIGVDMHACLPAKETEIIFQPSVVLPAADVHGNLRVEGLDAYLELQGSRRKFRDHFAQRLRQSVRYHFEMDKQSGTMAFQEEFQDGLARGDIEVERAIDELELAHAAVQQLLHFRQQQRQA